jgi:hypothetical protein
MCTKEKKCNGLCAKISHVALIAICKLSFGKLARNFNCETKKNTPYMKRVLAKELLQRIPIIFLPIYTL